MESQDDDVDSKHVLTHLCISCVFILHCKKQPGFFKRVVMIPCMRSSLLNGISSGLGIGLTYFLITSNVSKATNWGVGSFLLVMYGTWGFCRYQRAKEQHIAQLWQKSQQENSGNIKFIDPKDV